MESEWSDAKKSLDLSLRQTSQALALLNDINGQQTATHEKLLKLVQLHYGDFYIESNKHTYIHTYIDTLST